MAEAQSPRLQGQAVHAEILLEQAVMFGATVAGIAGNAGIAGQRVTQMGESTTDVPLAPGQGDTSTSA